MKRFKNLFGKRANGPNPNKEHPVNLAFVLLSDKKFPNADTIKEAFIEFSEPGDELETSNDVNEEDTTHEFTKLELSTGETAFISLIPAAVPDGEAEYWTQFSMSSLMENWELPPHHAHLMIVFQPTASARVLTSFSRFTSLIAAVIQASSAVGVYWGDAGATHDAEFFTTIAVIPDAASRLMLWSGVSVAREDDGRLSLLSMGMEQFNLPNLLLVSGEASDGIALETLYDLLAYAVQRGEPIPEGDTVGRTEEERLVVKYVKSPAEPKKRVWRVELL
ncbi:MAG: DUF4261 domain-containing protein [Verrucomicrobia bacterium]|nr:DUF4261 domain-containing protein [Verrucomicrobiota bacterium]MCH8512199.1 DUF4261 domain-containing protein [Kiritimatiellia bacterium]